MSQETKKVLAVAFDFPPRRTSGIYRPTGMIKYLVKLGWKPTVLSVRTLKTDLEDYSLLDRVPSGVQIVRTSFLNVAGWENTAAQSLRSVVSLPPPNASSRPLGWHHFLRRAANLVRTCLYFPDEMAGWLPFALAQAVQLCMARRYDVIYTTSPPRTTLVIGLFLKYFLRLPWVIEYRDPWHPSPSPLRRRVDDALQSLILRKADSIVVVTQGHKNELMGGFHVPGEKVTVIRNGFEESDFKNLDAQPADFFETGFLHLSHFGTIYNDASGTFFQALGEIVEETPGVKSFLRVNIIGYPDDSVRRAGERDDLREIVRFYPFIPHDRVLAAMRSSDCLLLFWGRKDYSRLAVAGKTYEYMRIGRPILAIAYEGDMKWLVENARAGWALNPEDKEGIKEMLRLLIRNHHENLEFDPPDPEFVSQFSYERLAAQLAKLFDSVSSYAR